MTDQPERVDIEFLNESFKPKVTTDHPVMVPVNGVDQNDTASFFGLNEESKVEYPSEPARR